jgi:hypothetical protein
MPPGFAGMLAVGLVKDRTISASTRAVLAIFSAVAASMLKSKAVPYVVSISI